ncbi:MAG: hypothetical protein AB1457_16425 [Chloroflexota bacterium]
MIIGITCTLFLPVTDVCRSYSPIVRHCNCSLRLSLGLPGAFWGFFERIGHLTDGGGRQTGKIPPNETDLAVRTKKAIIRCNATVDKRSKVYKIGISNKTVIKKYEKTSPPQAGSIC